GKSIPGQFMADFCTLGQVMHHVTTCCFTGCFPPNTTLFVSLPLFFCRPLAHLSGGRLFSLKKEWARETRHCSLLMVVQQSHFQRPRLQPHAHSRSERTPSSWAQAALELVERPESPCEE